MIGCVPTEPRYAVRCTQLIASRPPRRTATTLPGDRCPDTRVSRAPIALSASSTSGQPRTGAADGATHRCGGPEGRSVSGHPRVASTDRRSRPGRPRPAAPRPARPPITSWCHAPPVHEPRTTTWSRGTSHPHRRSRRGATSRPYATPAPRPDRATRAPRAPIPSWCRRAARPEAPATAAADHRSPRGATGLAHATPAPRPDRDRDDDGPGPSSDGGAGPGAGRSSSGTSPACTGPRRRRRCTRPAPW